MPSTSGTVQTIDNAGGTLGWLLQNELLPALRPASPGARARVVEQLAEGRAVSDNVRFVLFDDGGAPLVIRSMHRRFNPLRPWGRLRRFAQTAEMTEFVRAHGIPAPRIHRVFQGVVWRKMVQYTAIAEECIEGIELSRRDPEHVRGAFGLLGRMHAVRSDRWGRPGFLAGGTARDFARGEIADLGMRCARGIWKKLPDASASRLRHLLHARTNQWLAAAGDEPFALVHGDMKAANCLRRPDGEFCLIDFHHTRRSMGSMEFLDSLAHFCGSNGFAPLAAQAYFAEAGSAAAAELRTAGNLALAMATLRRAHARKGDVPRPAPDAVIALLEDGAPAPLADAPRADWNAVVASIRGQADETAE